MTHCSRRIHDFSPQQILQLREMKFIPTVSGPRSPSTVFLISEDSAHSSKDFNRLFSGICLDSTSNAFLRAIGVTDRPSLERTVAMLTEEAQQVLDTVKDPEQYQELLQIICRAKASLTRGQIQKLAKSSCFLGFKRTASIKTSDGADGETHFSHALLPASSVSFNNRSSHPAEIGKDLCCRRCINCDVIRRSDIYCTFAERS